MADPQDFAPQPLARSAERRLVLYLRFYAAVLLLALPAAVAPTSWLAAIHAGLGLGEWPDRPVVGYLARSASGLYAFCGGIVLIASFDVRRSRPLLVYLGLSSLVGGVYLLVLDLVVGLPLWWALTDGLVVVVTGLVLLVLLRAVPPG
jgi:hypothetical protein